MTTSSLNQLGDALDACSTRCSRAKTEHGGLRDVHNALRGLHSQLKAAADAGDATQLRDLSAKFGTQLEAATQAHRRLADAHAGLERSLTAAQLALDGHRGELDDAQGDASDPTNSGKGTSAGSGPAGAQTSAGFSTKALPLTAAEIRAHDQAVAVDHCYRAKIAALRAR